MTLLLQFLCFFSCLLVGASILYYDKKKVEFKEFKDDMTKEFELDLAYTLDLITELTYPEAESKIDDFEEKWMNYVSKDKFNKAIGKLKYLV